jgi:hypothetical protein
MSQCRIRCPIVALRVAYPHPAPAGYRPIPALADGRRLGENALAVGPPRDVQPFTESGGFQ